MLTRRTFLASASASLLAGPALAQTYPTQTIRIIAGFPPGGGIDLSARLIADPLKDALGQTVIVENRTGAAGMLAANTVAKASPDGHMLLMATSGEIAIAQHLYKEKMTYDPQRELAPIALIGIVPCVVVVADSTPVHNPKELIAYAKANAGKLSFSSSGVGNPQQLAGELMNMMAGTNVLHVPYRGAAPAVTDVATGAVTMSFTSLAAALPLLKAGKLRAVAVTSQDRMPQLPDVAAAAGRRARTCRLRAAQLVRPVHDRRHAAADRRPPQRHRQRGAEGPGDRRQARSAGHRAAADERGGIQEVRRLRRREKFGKIIVQANIKVAD